METRRTGWLRSRRFRSGFLALAVLAALGARMFRPHAATIDAGIGRPVADFTLADTSGRPVSLHGYQGKAAVVLVFTGTDCPVGNLYMPRLVELSRAYRDKGVAFLVINANAHETAEQVAEHARSYHVEFPVLKDPGNLVADRLRRRADVRDAGDRRPRPASLPGCDRRSVRAGDAQGRGDAELPGRGARCRAGRRAGRRAEHAGRRLPDRPGRRDRGRRATVPGSSRRPRDPSPPSRQRDEPVAVGPVTYCGGRRPDRPGEVPVVPPARPGRAVLAPDLRRRPGAGPRSIREVVEDRRMPPWHADPRLRPLPQRPRA